jgi:DNA-binding transcriptional regulator YiaG
VTLLDAPSAARIGIEEDTESTWPWLTSTKLAVSLLKGTSTSCSLPLDLQIEAIGDSTGRGGFTAPAEEDDASSSGSIRRLRAQSGLSWEQLARLFAVSRRSVHKWSNGGPLNAHHMERLAHITQVVDSLGVDPASVRPKLLVSMAGGITLYQQLI